MRGRGAPQCGIEGCDEFACQCCDAPTPGTSLVHECVDGSGSVACRLCLVAAEIQSRLWISEGKAFPGRQFVGLIPRQVVVNQTFTQKAHQRVDV